MAIKIYDRYAPNANPPDADHPQGSFKNASTPTATDGTPVEVDWSNDRLGFTDCIMAKAGLTYSGVPDTALASDRYDALRKLFAAFMSYEEPSGTPPAIGVYTIQAVNGTDIEAYFNGMILNVFFRTRYDGVDPARLKIGSLPPKNITETDGSAILENRLLSNASYDFRYNASDDRFEILTRPILPFQILFEHEVAAGIQGVSYLNTNVPKRWPVTLVSNPPISIPGASLGSELITLPKGFLYKVEIFAAVDDSSSTNSRTRTYVAESSDPTTPVLTDVADAGFTNHSAVINGYLDYSGLTGTVILGIYTRSPNGGVMGTATNNIYPEKYLVGRIIQIRS
jgi:hypothetical protein